MNKYFFTIPFFIYFQLCACFTFAQLTGTYTIGGLNPDYDSINNAVNDLRVQGVSGKVIFNIRPGTYYETIVIDSIENSSPVNTITFRSETGDSTDVIIANNNPNTYSSVIELRYVNDIIFKSLTIINESENYCQAFLVSYCTNINIENCCISAPNGFNYDLVVSISYTNTFTFINSIITGTSSGIGMNFIQEKSQLSNNLFENTGRYSIEASRADNIILLDNIFSGWVDILFGDTNLIMNNIFKERTEIDRFGTVSDNYFHKNTSIKCDELKYNKFNSSVRIVSPLILRNSFNGGDLTGNKIFQNTLKERFDIVDSDYSKIFGNIIYGKLYIRKCNNALIANNIILDNIDFSWSNTIKIYNNNFSKKSSFNAPSYSRIYNNNFAQDFEYKPYKLANNNYYPEGGKFDGNPTNYDPQYLNDSDLYTQNPLLIDKGVSLMEVFYDIDSILRKIPPSMGANEICISSAIAQKGIELSCGDSVKLVLCNISDTGTYIWTPITGLSNPNIPFPKASPENTTNYVVRNVNTGLMDSVLVKVVPFKVETIKDTTITCSDSVFLRASFNSSATYQWYPSTNLNSSDIRCPVAKPNKTTNYIVQANVDGCKTTYDTVTLTVEPFKVKITSYDSVIHCDDEAYLWATYNINATYQWFPPDVDWPNSYIEARPKQKTTYIVSATIPDCGTSYDSFTVEVDSLPWANASITRYDNLIECTNNSTCADSFLWDFGDNTTSIEFEPVHIYQTVGDYDLSLVAYNEYGTDTFFREMPITFIGIKEDNRYDKFKCYPNPNDGTFTIKLNANAPTGYVSITIVNSLGKNIFDDKIRYFGKEIKKQIKLSSCAKGIYFVVLRFGKQILNEKIVIF